jgi:hypothetical protein
VLPGPYFFVQHRRHFKFSGSQKLLRGIEHLSINFPVIGFLNSRVGVDGFQKPNQEKLRRDCRRRTTLSIRKKAADGVSVRRLKSNKTIGIDGEAGEDGSEEESEEDPRY